MSKQIDLLSINDLLNFIKNNFIIIFIITIIFSSIGLYYNNSLTSQNNLVKDKFIEINFVYQENEVGYLMNYVDNVINNSSVNVNFHHMFIDVIDKPGIAKNSVVEQIQNTSDKKSTHLENKFSKINHINFIYQTALADSLVDLYLEANNIDYNNLAIIYDKFDHSISLKFISVDEINETMVTEITNIFNTIGFQEIQKAIEAKIIYQDNLINNIIKDLNIISKINKDSFYKNLRGELHKVEFALGLLSNGNNIQKESLDQIIRSLDDYNYFILNKDYLSNRLKIINNIINDENYHVESVEFIKNYILRFENDNTTDYVKDIFYNSNVYKTNQFFKSYYSEALIVKNYVYSVYLIIFPIFGFLLGLLAARIYRSFK